MSKDVKGMIAQIRGALDGYPREQLQEILTWVFKEYVVEGGSAPAQGALAMLDARSELEGLSFAELVTWLQLHLDVPELAALEVQGARVSVRAGGRTVPIEVAARPPEPLPAAQATAQTPQPAAVSQQPSAQPVTTPAATASANPLAPTTRANPTSGNPPAPTTNANSPTTNANPPATNANPAAPAAKAEEKDEKKDDASRFSWLEVD